MAQFQSKQRIVSAEQFDGETLIKGVCRRPQAESASIEKPFVVTIHGQETTVEKGDWIIQEPDGEHYYPCKPDIFADRYEPAVAVAVKSNQNALDVKPALSQGLTVGRMVHYVLAEGRNRGDHRPAIVVRVWNDVPSYPEGTINLQVFTDGPNDGSAYAEGTVWRTSVHYSEGKEFGTWHWIEKA